MRLWLVFGLLFFVACGSEPEKPTVAIQKQETTAPADTNKPAVASDVNFIKDTIEDDVPVAPVTKKPSGFYRFSLPTGSAEKMLQTVAFYPITYRLQEEYGEKDSTVITEGTWAPSQGTIWLYKEQILRGRYTWKGDTLQYYSPRLKKSFSMQRLTPAAASSAWQAKRKEGALLYGVGNESFWSVELNNQDSVVLNMPDWTEPLRTKVLSSNIAKDSATYATADSLHLTVYPYFCNDGMSDFVYTQKLKLEYKGKTYTGCGEVLRRGR